MGRGEREDSDPERGKLRARGARRKRRDDGVGDSDRRPRGGAGAGTEALRSLPWSSPREGSCGEAAEARAPGDRREPEELVGCQARARPPARTYCRRRAAAAAASPAAAATAPARPRPGGPKRPFLPLWASRPRKGQGPSD